MPLGPPLPIVRISGEATTRTVPLSDDYLVMDSVSIGTARILGSQFLNAGSSFPRSQLTGTEPWSVLTSTPTTLAGYGITDPIVLTSGTYSNPAWITALAWSKLTGNPTTVAGLGVTNGATIDSWGAKTVPAGVVADLTSTQTFTGKSIAATQLTGTLAAAQEPAHTGDVTNTAGSLAMTIAAGAVTLAKQATLAANSIQGNNTGSAATPLALTVAQTWTLLGVLPAANEPAHTGDVTNTVGNLATTVKGVNGTLLSGLATGLLKNTTATGVPSIAVAGTDYSTAGATETLTNKTYNTAGTGNVFQLNGQTFTSLGTNLSITAGVLNAASSGFANPMTTLGDIIVGGAAGVATRLALGGNGTFVGVSGGVIGYFTPAGGGNVSNSGTPTSGQTAQWNSATTLIGVANTGTGSYVLATSPTLVTPVLGAASATTVNGNTLTTGTWTLTGVAAKTLTFNNTLTLAGTDATVMTFPASSATIARTDAANTFTGHQTIEGVTTTGATGTGALVFASSPSLVTPAIGVATGTSLNLSGALTVAGAVAINNAAATQTAVSPIYSMADSNTGGATFDLRNGVVAAGTFSITQAGVANWLTIAKTTGIVTLSSTTASTTSATGALVVAGGLGIAGDLFAGATVNGTQLKSTVATGTAPLVVASTTQVANLNVSALQGFTWSSPAGIGTVAPTTGAFTTLSASSTFGVGAAATGATPVLFQASATGTAQLSNCQILGNMTYGANGQQAAELWIQGGTLATGAFTGLAWYGIAIQGPSTQTGSMNGSRTMLYLGGCPGFTGTNYSIQAPDNGATAQISGFLQVGGSIGYGPAGSGFGGTVTQATSKSTGFTLNLATGQFTLAAGSLAGDTTVSAVFSNNRIAAGDVLVMNHVSGGTVGSYTFNAQCAAGSATINIHNTTPGALNEQPAIQFVLIKGVST